MCVNDWRLGRLIRAVTISGTGVTIANATIPQNKARVGVLFGYASATLAVNNALNVLMDGNIIAMVGMGSPTFHLAMTTHGDMSTHAFTMSVIGAATGTWSITEFILPESYLAAGVEEFQRLYGRH